MMKKSLVIAGVILGLTLGAWGCGQGNVAVSTDPVGDSSSGNSAGDTTMESTITDIVTEERTTEEETTAQMPTSEGELAEETLNESLTTEVLDTIFPEMEVAADYIIGREGEVLPVEDLIVKVVDDDPECRLGLLGFDYVSSFDGFDFYHIETTVPIYEQTMLDPEIELLSEITIPAEEGVYASTAVAVDRSGNAATSTIYFLVDNSAPEIHLPTEHIKLKPGQGYDFMDGVSCSDNLYPAEYCGVGIEEADWSALEAFLNMESPGTWKFFYSAEDPSGNYIRKEVKVTLEGKSGGDSAQTAQNGFDLSQAKEAFAKINEYRRNAGLNELSWNETLYEAAKIRAQELVVLYDHTRPDGSHCSSVKEQVGWGGTTGENIAKGTAPFPGWEVAEVWYNSDGHRQNMLIPQYNYGAIACYVQDGWAYWVNIFSN